MLQTIFLKDKPIYLSNDLTENLLLNAQLTLQHNGDSDIDLSLKLFEDTKTIKSLLIFNENFSQLIEAFNSRFKIIEAAGGVVLNKDGNVLLIYRYDRWDLPKGKLEKNESPELGGIREVQEECGVKDIVITSDLQKTYHCFEHNGEKTLKITHWYKMICNDVGLKLMPQSEEGITDAKWCNKNEVTKAMDSAYGSIKLIIEEAIK
jgi:8-oxo-dGTP pyrophosphatase MutT (NUDIX family)